MKSLLMLFFIYSVFNCAVICQDTIIQNGDTIIRAIPVYDECPPDELLIRKTISDSIYIPELINKYSISETIARQMLFTNEFSIQGTSHICFFIDFTVDENGIIIENSYESYCKYKNINYSIIIKDSLLKYLKLWKPAVLVENRKKKVKYKFIVLVNIYFNKVSVGVYTTDHEPIELQDFPRPLVFK